MYHRANGQSIRKSRPLCWRFGIDDPADAERKADAGYALAQHIKAVSDDLLQIEEGSLYPALQRMLKAGWLKSEMGLSARNRPVRVFKLTAAGRKRLEEERLSFEKMFAGINRVLAVAQS